MQFFLKGSPFPHDKAPSNPKTQGTSPTTGLVYAVSCGTKTYLSIFFRATERLRYQRSSHAGERLRDQRLSRAGAAARSTPLTHTISRLQLVMPRPRASRSSSHRYERWEGVSGLTWHSRGSSPATQLELFNQLQLSLYRVSLCARPGGPSATPSLFLSHQLQINKHNLRLRHPRHGQSSFTAQGLSAASNSNRSHSMAAQSSLQLRSPDQSTTWRGISAAVVRDALASTVPTSS